MGCEPGTAEVRARLFWKEETPFAPSRARRRTCPWCGLGGASIDVCKPALDPRAGPRRRPLLRGPAGYGKGGRRRGCARLPSAVALSVVRSAARGVPGPLRLRRPRALAAPSPRRGRRRVRAGGPVPRGDCSRPGTRVAGAPPPSLRAPSAAPHSRPAPRRPPPRRLPPAPFDALRPEARGMDLHGVAAGVVRV